MKKSALTFVRIGWRLLLLCAILPASAEAGSGVARAGALHEQAVKAYDGGDLTGAMALERKAVGLAPRYWLPHAGLACILVGLNQNDKAVREAQLAVDCDARNKAAILNQAKIEHLSVLYSRAIEHYRAALALDSRLEEARLGLAQCNAMIGKRNEAVQSLNDLQNANLQDPGTQLLVAEAYLKLGDLVNAKRCLQRPILLGASQPDKDRAASLLFLAAVKSNDTSLAAKLYSQILKGISSDKDVAIACLTVTPPATPDAGRTILDAVIAAGRGDGVCCFELSKSMRAKAKACADAKLSRLWLDLALESINTALAARPINGDFLLERAAVYDCLTRYKESLRDLEKSKLCGRSDRAITLAIKAVRLQTTDLAYAAKQKLVSGESKDEASPDSRPYRLTIFIADFELRKPHCLCRAKSMQYQMREKAGVLASAISQTEPIHGILLYDAKQVESKKIFAVAKPEDNFVEISDERAVSIADLVDALESSAVLEAQSSFVPFNPRSLRMPL